MSLKSRFNRLSILGLSLALFLVILALLVGCSSTPTPTPTPTSTTPAVSATPTPTTPASPSPSPTPRTSFNPKEVLLSSTTSVRDTGLMDKLIPLFQQQSGLTVTPVYVGSGAAIALGNTGNADVMVVHSPQDELKFVASGNGINRRLIAHNDFVLLGPASDPAKVKGTTTAVDAFKAIITAAQAGTAGVAFYSRGDNSGTDAKDKAIFKSAGLTVADKSSSNPKWYVEASGGMGPLLTIADQNQGYVLSDRGTYLAYQDKITLQILSQGDPIYLNPYHVIQVNPAKFPGIVNAAGAQAFSDFMVGPDAQNVIANFKDKNGNLLFIADGGKTDADIGITQ